MLSDEVGIQAGSDVYFTTPSEMAQKFFYCLTCCGHYHAFYGYYYKREYYPDLLIAYVKKGEIILRYDGKEMSVKENTCFFIDCNNPHHYFVKNYCEFLFAHFNGQDARKIYQEIYRNYGCLFIGKNYLPVYKLLDNIIVRFRNEQPLSEAESSSLLYQTIFCLFPNSNQTDLSFLSSEVVQRSIVYIHEHLADELSIKGLSSVEGLSPYYFSHIFKKHTGSSPYDYIITTRLNKGKHLLRTTDMSINEVADAIGFNSPNRFTNSFTQRVGISPKQFREFIF